MIKPETCFITLGVVLNVVGIPGFSLQSALQNLLVIFNSLGVSSMPFHRGLDGLHVSRMEQ